MKNGKRGKVLFESIADRPLSLIIICLIGGGSFAILFISQCIAFITNPPYSINEIITFTIVLLTYPILTTIFLLFVFNTYFTYLKIYETEIRFRTPGLFKYLKKKFVPLEKIKNVEIRVEGMEDGSKREFLDFKIEDTKTFVIDCYYVKNYKDARDLILKLIQR